MATNQDQVSQNLRAFDNAQHEQDGLLLPTLRAGAPGVPWSDEYVEKALAVCFGQRRRQFLRAFGHAGFGALALTVALVDAFDVAWALGDLFESIPVFGVIFEVACVAVGALAALDRLVVVMGCLLRVHQCRLHAMLVVWQGMAVGESLETHPRTNGATPRVTLAPAPPLTTVTSGLRPYALAAGGLPII